MEESDFGVLVYFEGFDMRVRFKLCGFDRGWWVVELLFVNF